MNSCPVCFCLWLFIEGITVAPSRFFCFEKSRQTNVIFGHDTIQHILRSFGISQGQLVEFNQVIEDQRESDDYITKKKSRLHFSAGEGGIG